jgi:beta-xylosidase
MLLTILSMLGGGFMRLLPELLTFLNKKTDNAHELAMLDRQFELEDRRAAARVQQIEVQGNIDHMLALLDAQKAALSGQMQKVGIRWVDAANFAVRPLTTYFFLAMYGVVKLATLVVAMRNTDPWLAVLQVWSADDAAILAGILAFWFVGRVFDKK